MLVSFGLVNKLIHEVVFGGFGGKEKGMRGYVSDTRVRLSHQPKRPFGAHGMKIS